MRQRSQIILKTATAKKIAGRLMHFPGTVVFQAFEIGRQANTKQQIRANDPVAINVAISNRVYRSQSFSAINR